MTAVRPWNQRLGRALFATVGMLLLAVGLWHGGQAYRFVEETERADGVIQAEPGRPEHFKPGHPRIAFATQDGRHASFRQNGGLSRPAGSHVSVRYRPEHPAETAQVDVFWSIWGFPVVWPLMMGSGFLLVVLRGGEMSWREPDIGG